MRTLMMAAALVGLAGTAPAQTISSTFDADADGWVSGSLESGLPGGNTVAYDGATHSIVASDPDGDYSGFLAPAKFRGNLSAYAGGTISFQLADGEGNTQYEAPLALFGTAGTLYAFLPTPPSTDLTALTSYSISLTAANFYVGGAGAAGTPATALQLAAVLANVTALGIGLDYHNGSDNTRLDNVVLAAAPTATVPEPAAWATMAAGFGLLGLALRRRRPPTALAA